MTKDGQPIAIRSRGFRDIGENGIAQAARLPQRTLKQVQAARSCMHFLQLRQSRNLFGIANQNIGQKVAALEQRQRLADCV